LAAIADIKHFGHGKIEKINGIDFHDGQGKSSVSIETRYARKNFASIAELYAAVNQTQGLSGTHAKRCDGSPSLTKAPGWATMHAARSVPYQLIFNRESARNNRLHMTVSVVRPSLALHPASRTQLQAGITLLADMVAATLGPMRGPVYSYDATRRRVEALDDTATALRRILGLGRPDLDVGAMLVRQMAWRLEQRVGDGGATAVVLLRALVDEGQRQVTAGANAMRLIQGVRRAADVGELSYLLGPDGQLQVDTFVGPYLERAYIAGASYAARIASMYFYTEAERQRAVANAPAVALLDEPLKESAQAVALMEAALAAERKALVIIAPDISGAALNVLVANHALPADKRKLTVLAVSVIPPAGGGGAYTQEDLSLLTGATVLGNSGVRSSRTAQAADLGQAHRIEFVNKQVIVLATAERRRAIPAAVEQLQRRLATLDLEDEQRPLLARRLATLTGGIGQLKIGAHNEPARDVRRSQAERAWKVLSSTQRGGVVPGGGAALIHCLSALHAAIAQEPNAEMALGMRVVAGALAAPQRQMAANAGVPAPASIVHQVRETGPSAAYDVLAGELVDAHRSGLVDAVEVVSTIVQVAVSAATMVLSTDAIVYHRNPKQSFEP
jgi:chaperonin GroEL